MNGNTHIIGTENLLKLFDGTFCSIDRCAAGTDADCSNTRHEELLVKPDVLQKTWILRKVLNELNNVEAMELLIEKLAKTKTNEEFLNGMNQK